MEKNNKTLKKYLCYDREMDLFAVHKGFAQNEKFKTNIDAGGVILDISNKGRIRGIEILNCSKFFKGFNIKQKTLHNLYDATFEAVIKSSRIFLAITLKTKDVEEISTKIAFPLKAF